MEEDSEQGEVKQREGIEAEKNPPLQERGGILVLTFPPLLLDGRDFFFPSTKLHRCLTRFFP